MTIEIRRTTADEYRQASNVLSVGYLQKPITDERWEKSRPSWENMVSFSAWDGARCVGHGGQHEVETNLPGGGLVPTGAITRVGVLPTHHRRGAGTGIMKALLDDAAQRSWPLASLRASESLIYRRYGFGVAGEFADAVIDTARAKPLTASVPGEMRLLPADEILATTEAIDTASLSRRPGLITRPGTWREYNFRDAVEQTTSAVVAVHRNPDGHDDGYIHYSTEWLDLFGKAGAGKVIDVVAESSEVELALWSYLFDVDLVRSWTAEGRPVDDLVKEAMADRRAYVTTGVNDEQWLRLIDVDRALTARAWNPVGDSIVIEVNDPYFESNNGRWQISAEAAAKTNAEPDLVAGVDALAALYLGGMSWLTEAAVGRVGPGAAIGSNRSFEEALRLGDLLFAGRPLPFCGTFF